MIWAILASVAVLVILDLFVQWPYVKTVLPMFELAPPFDVQTYTPVPEATEIEFRTTNGLTLRGSLYAHADRSPRGLIVFGHEFLGSHWSTLSYCRGLWEAGFDILAFDFRNQGTSDSLEAYRPLHWVTQYEVEDFLSAVSFARSREEYRDVPVGAYGISKGGAAALLATARNPEIRCVVSDSTVPTNGMMRHFAERWAPLCVDERLLRLVPQWHIGLTLALVQKVSEWKRRCRYTSFNRWLPELAGRRALLISGKCDTYVPAKLTNEMADRIGSMADVWIVPKAKHNRARQKAPEEYDARLVEFFCQMTDDDVRVSTVPELGTVGEE